MKILIVDDDETFSTLVARYLGQRGYDVTEAHSGPEGLKLLAETKPDLVILDVMMPGMDGWQVMAALRQESNAPVLFLTAMSGEEDAVRGLELGAVDYLKKPVGLKELEARIRARLRPVAEAAPVYDDGRLRIDLPARTVQVAGQAIHLSPREFKLLAYLVERQGRPVERSELLTAVWGAEYAQDFASLQVYIRYLREKLEPDPKRPQIIVTEWGVGYRFRQKAEGHSVPTT